MTAEKSTQHSSLRRLKISKVARMHARLSDPKEFLGSIGDNIFALGARYAWLWPWHAIWLALPGCYNRLTVIASSKQD